MTDEIVSSGTLLDETIEVTLSDLCYACAQPAEWVDALVAEGVLEPIGGDLERKRFSANDLDRAQAAMRLQRDLGVNIAGIALALDLLDEVKTLRARLVHVDIEISRG